MSKSILIFTALVLLGCTSKVEEFNQQGHLNFLLGKYNAAESDYSKVIAIDQKNSEAYFGRGLSSASSASQSLMSSWYRDYMIPSINAEYAKAIIDFTKVIEIEPQNAEAYRCRGFIKYKLLDFRGSIDDYNEVVRIKPFEESSFMDRIIPRIEIKDLIGIERDCSKAIEINPKNVLANVLRQLFRSDYKNWGETFNGPIYEGYDWRISMMDQGYRWGGLSYEEMLVRWNNEDYGYGRSESEKKAIELIRSHLNHLSSSVELRDSSKINKYYMEVLQKNPNFNYNEYQKGAEYIRSLYFRKSLAKYNTQLEANQLNNISLFKRAEINFSLQNYIGSNKDYSQVIQLDAKNIEAYYNRACVRFNLHNYGGAVADYSKVIEIDPRNAISYYNRGLIFLIKLNQKEKACKDFSTAGELGYQEAYVAIKESCQY